MSGAALLLIVRLSGEIPAPPVNKDFKMQIQAGAFAC